MDECGQRRREKIKSEVIYGQAKWSPKKYVFLKRGKFSALHAVVSPVSFERRQIRSYGRAKIRVSYLGVILAHLQVQGKLPPRAQPRTPTSTFGEYSQIISITKPCAQKITSKQEIFVRFPVATLWPINILCCVRNQSVVNVVAIPLRASLSPVLDELINPVSRSTSNVPHRVPSSPLSGRFSRIFPDENQLPRQKPDAPVTRFDGASTDAFLYVFPITSERM